MLGQFDTVLGQVWRGRWKKRGKTQEFNEKLYRRAKIRVCAVAGSIQGLNLAQNGLTWGHYGLHTRLMRHIMAQHMGQVSFRCKK